MPDRASALLGAVWVGGQADVIPDAAVLVDERGRVAWVGRADDLPEDVRRVGGPGCWVGPGIVDAHVHLAFADPPGTLAGAVVAARDLGAPLDRALAWRAPGRVAVAGPLLTAPGGYPSRSWGADGFARAVSAAAVRELAAAGVDVVKVALEPAGGAPVPTPDEVRAAVGAAHDAGLAVTAHALTVAMVERALDAGVDELCHTPAESLPPALVERVAAAGVPVVSTLETLAACGYADAVTANAAALHAAGVRLVYGTDLGNAGTRPGADPRELERLAAAGLGRLGALRAATRPVAVGEPAALVVLPGDPLTDPTLWERPLAVVRATDVAGRGRG